MDRRRPSAPPCRAFRRAAWPLLLLALRPAVSAADRAAAPPLRVAPAAVDIGLGFHGAPVRLSVVAPAGATAVFRLVGPEHDVKLKVKGRVAGVLWASVGVVHFAGVPSVLLVHAMPEAPANDALREAGLLPEALAGRLLPPDARPADRDNFAEMIRLFESEGKYAVARAGSAGPGGALETEFDLPPTAPTGRYVADVTFFRDGIVAGRSTAELEVRTTGLVALVSRLAAHQGLWYGLAAVLVAVVAGLLTGVVFGRGAKGGH